MNPFASANEELAGDQNLTSGKPELDSREAFFAARPVSPHLDLAFDLAGLKLANPVMPASGCFGPELGRLIPITEIGATVTKTVFDSARGGNPPHRLTEIPAGMVNSVGIPSRGPGGYLEKLHSAYLELGIPVIVSVGGHRPVEYAEVVEQLGGAGDAYELNVSCPNLDREGIDIGADPDAIVEAVSHVRAVTDKPVIVKLSPMVASISVCAQAAESAGADAVCISNSIPVLSLEPHTREPSMGNLVGGLTGPAVRPIVLRLVWQAARTVRIPVIACGGVETADDVLEYFSVGAQAVQVGTANFARPFAMVEIVRELIRRCVDTGVGSIAELANPGRSA